DVLRAELVVLQRALVDLGGPEAGEAGREGGEGEQEAQAPGGGAHGRAECRREAPRRLGFQVANTPWRTHPCPTFFGGAVAPAPWRCAPCSAVEPPTRS